MSDNEIVIDETNFTEFFRDVKTSKPQQGDVLVVYRSMAELTDGELKEQMVDALICAKVGAQKAIQLFIKLGSASYKEAVKVVKQMCQDLVDGLDTKSVILKPYKFLLELQFYTRPEYVPENNPHWEVIKLKNYSGKTEDL